MHSEKFGRFHRRKIKKIANKAIKKVKEAIKKVKEAFVWAFIIQD